MKPKEFDELIRQKFDQNDFAYESRNWDSLAEQMDGRAKKRSVMVWWLVPLAGIAASVAMAMGVTFFYQQSEKGLHSTNAAFVQPNNNIEKPRTIQNEPVTAMVTATPQYLQITKTKNNSSISAQKKNIEETFGISFENAVGFQSATHRKSIVLQDELIPKKDKKPVDQNQGYATFKPEEEQEFKKPVTNSITLAGGINHGNENSGYMVGANLRHMVNSRFFVESDVAFANSNNTQATLVQAPTTGGSAARHAAGAARSTATEGSRPLATDAPAETFENENQPYSLYYAQVSPGLGYKVMSKMSVGVGPDFQQALGDNRPAPNAADRNNTAVAPLFDVGFMGKTEYSLTKKMKAGVIYRKGVNNLLTPMDKYIDRDYLQFQLKCTVFNK